MMCIIRKIKNPNLTKLTNISLFPENDKEKNQIENRMWAFQSEQYKEEEPSFANLIDKIKDQISSDYKKYFNGCVCIYDQDIIKKVIPGIIDELDKDGLVKTSKLKEIMPGVYEREGFILATYMIYP